MRWFTFIITVIVIVNASVFGQDQPSLTRDQWDRNLTEARHSAHTAKTQKVIGAVMIVAGPGLMIYGGRAGRHDVQAFSTCHSPSGPFPPTECTSQDRIERVASKPVIISGALVLAGGIWLAYKGTKHQRAANERVRQLLDVGKVRGWSFSIQSLPSTRASLSVAYSW